MRFEENTALSSSNSAALYKALKARNSTIEKFRDEYQRNFFKSITSIFDNKIRLDDDSLSDEETKHNQIELIADETEDRDEENYQDPSELETRPVSRAREAPYRLIFIPGYLYDSHSLVFAKEIL